MLRTIKPKNARSKRALDKREPKVVENPKVALFARGSQTSAIINSALSDLYALKKPDGINFTKKNQIHPFEDESTMQFWSQKNDASLFVVGTHSKKRPNNLTFIRMFDHQIMDMIELGIEKFSSMSEFKGAKCAIGMKPLMIFNGDQWELGPHKHFKNMILDFFRGQEINSINLAGLEYIISVTAGPAMKDGKPGKVYFRVYMMQMKKSGTKVPRVEINEMGPSIEFVFRRVQEAKDEIWKMATKQPKELKPKKVKNIAHDDMGDAYGRIHLGKQDISKLQTRKMKGLKKRGVDDIDEVNPKKRKLNSDDE